MAYGYQEHDNAKPVMDAIDLIDAHMLPFFAQDTSTGEWSFCLVFDEPLDGCCANPSLALSCPC